MVLQCVPSLIRSSFLYYIRAPQHYSSASGAPAVLQEVSNNLEESAPFQLGHSMAVLHDELQDTATKVRGAYQTGIRTGPREPEDILNLVHSLGRRAPSFDDENTSAGAVWGAQMIYIADDHRAQASGRMSPLEYLTMLEMLAAQIFNTRLMGGSSDAVAKCRQLMGAQIAKDIGAGHVAHGQPPQQQAQQRRGLATTRCHLCGKLGHMQATCSRNNTSNQGQGRGAPAPARRRQGPPS
jgi:hypothetical protein